MLNAIKRQPEVQNENWLNSMPAKSVCTLDVQRKRLSIDDKEHSVLVGLLVVSFEIGIRLQSSFSPMQVCADFGPTALANRRPSARKGRRSVPRQAGQAAPGGFIGRRLARRVAAESGRCSMSQRTERQSLLVLAHFLSGFFSLSGSLGSNRKPSGAGSITDVLTLSAAILRRTSSTGTAAVVAGGCFSIV
jgi:hypothetical protein